MVNKMGGERQSLWRMYCFALMSTASHCLSVSRQTRFPEPTFRATRFECFIALRAPFEVLMSLLFF